MTNEMDSEVFAHGESVGLFDMPKEEAEAKCKDMTAKSDYTYDWHYTMGRVHIKRLRKGFVKEDRYVLVKRKDLGHLSPEDRIALGVMLDKIAKGREAEGRTPVIQAVVIESDWNCYDAAWTLVRKEWGDKQETGA